MFKAVLLIMSANTFGLKYSHHDELCKLQAVRAVDVQTPDVLISPGTWAGSHGESLTTRQLLCTVVGGRDGRGRAGKKAEQPLLSLSLDTFEYQVRLNLNYVG